MSLRKSALEVARAVLNAPIIEPVTYHPLVRGALQKLPGFRSIYDGAWYRVHPFDRERGTETSGFVQPEELTREAGRFATSSPYAGSQPSIVRAALRTVPEHESATFIDFGCGKGRVLLVAAEFPFREVVGVELFPQLAEIAKRNAARVFRTGRARCAIRVEVSDAGTFVLPAGNLVIFFYNPFGEEIMRRVVARIESALAAESRSVFVVSYNPVQVECFDRSPAFTRYFAATIPHAPEERGYGPGTDDVVVIWQAGSRLPARPGAEAKVIVTVPNWSVTLESE